MQMVITASRYLKKLFKAFAIEIFIDQEQTLAAQLS
jgi:hypothetical protein